MQIKTGNADIVWRDSIGTMAGDLSLGKFSCQCRQLVSASDLGKGKSLKDNSVKLIKGAGE